MGDKRRGDALRTSAGRLLLAAALVIPLVMATLFIVLHRQKDLRGEAVELPARPLTDQQTVEEVLSFAREFLAAGISGNPTGSYALMPCRAEAGPPYQGSVYVNFDVPGIADTPAYFRSVVAAMAARGWTEGVRPNDHPGGRTLGRDGVSAVFYRNPDLPGRGVLQIYGPCSNMADHESDPAVFVDITARLLK